MKHRKNITEWVTAHTEARRVNAVEVTTPLADVIGTNAVLNASRSDLWTIVRALNGVAPAADAASRRELAEALTAALMAEAEAVPA